MCDQHGKLDHDTNTSSKRLSTVRDGSDKSGLGWCLWIVPAGGRGGGPAARVAVAVQARLGRATRVGVAPGGWGEGRRGVGVDCSVGVANGAVGGGPRASSEGAKMGWPRR